MKLRERLARRADRRAAKALEDEAAKGAEIIDEILSDVSEEPEPVDDTEE